jgi:hypothetical protein
MKARTIWKRMRGVLLVVVALLVGLRLALPSMVQKYVNRKLDELPEYDGHVGQVDIHLWRGAYAVDDVRIVKTEGTVTEPFFAAERVGFSVEWPELFRGSLVSEVTIRWATLNFIKARTEDDSQTSIDRSWVGVVEDLFPFKINRVELHESEVWYRDLESNPPVDLALTNVTALATNLTNARQAVQELPSALFMTAKTPGEGDLILDMRMNILAQEPAFDLNLEVREMDLTAFNDFLQAYAKADVNKGLFEVFVEIAARDGSFTGYVKPLFEELDVVSLKQDRNPFEIVWEGLVAGLVKLFKNQREDRFATQMPVSGNFDNPDVAVWRTIVNVLRNAFVEALPARIEGIITPDAVQEKER